MAQKIFSLFIVSQAILPTTGLTLSRVRMSALEPVKPVLSESRKDRKTGQVTFDGKTFDIYNVAPDGDCMFHALANQEKLVIDGKDDFKYGDTANAKAMRARIVDEGVSEDTKVIWAATQPPEDVKVSEVESYDRKMKKCAKTEGGVWGGEVELAGFSRLLPDDVELQIFKNNEHGEITRIRYYKGHQIRFYEDVAEKARVIRVGHGNCSGQLSSAPNHYFELIPTDEYAVAAPAPSPAPAGDEEVVDGPVEVAELAQAEQEAGVPVVLDQVVPAEGVAVAGEVQGQPEEAQDGGDALKTLTGGNGINVYLVLVGEALTHPPEGWSLLSEIPTTEPLLGFMHSDPEKHIYKLPVIEALSQLNEEWGTLQNSLHSDPVFERDLTRVEEKYLELVKSQNSDVDWDTSGSWSGDLVERGVGVVGGDDTGGLVPQNTLIIGFTNEASGHVDQVPAEGVAIAVVKEGEGKPKKAQDGEDGETPALVVASGDVLGGDGKPAGDVVEDVDAKALVLAEEAAAAGEAKGKPEGQEVEDSSDEEGEEEHEGEDADAEAAAAEAEAAAAAAAKLEGNEEDKKEDKKVDQKEVGDEDQKKKDSDAEAAAAEAAEAEQKKINDEAAAEAEQKRLDAEAAAADAKEKPEAEPLIFLKESNSSSWCGC